MKTICLYERGEPGYEIAAAFAKRVYRDELAFILDDPPELFLAIENEQASVQGAIGMNRHLTRTLFLEDPRVMRVLQKDGLDETAEQSVLALEGAELALPIFFAVLAAIAYERQIDRIVFAGINVSLRTLERIGFAIREICPADPATLHEDEKSNYVKWFSLYTPIVCTVETKDARAIALRLLQRWKHRIALSERVRGALRV